MKKNKVFDLLWPFFVIVFVLIMLSEFFHGFSSNHSYISAFIKFAVLAPMGELLVIRLSKKKWELSIGFIYKIIVWGFFGIAIAFSFKLFRLGVVSIIGNSIQNPMINNILVAFLTASFLNMTFGPVMMGSHKITDKFIELKCITGTNVTVNKAVKEVDWVGFITFVVFKTIPFFWIPAHTIVFLLPSHLRIIVAALLSIALGVLLTLAKSTKKEN